MPYLVIMRHGQSQSNLDRRVAGHIDTPLTEIGRQQARETAALIQDIRFDRAFTSTLSRTRDTLAEVVSVLGLTVPTTAHDDLRERCWGVQEGQPYGSGREKYSVEEMKSWFSWEGKAPQGESFADVSQRVVRFLEGEIIPELRTGKNILLVGHSNMLMTLQRYLEQVPHQETNDLIMENGEVKIYEFTHKGEVGKVSRRKRPD